MTAPWPEGCPLAPAGVAPGTCVGCAKPLPLRPDGTVHPLRRWCGDDCGRSYGRNHWWTAARFTALMRASVGWNPDLSLYWIICDQCGQQATSPEVNHVEPRIGAGYGTGCWNHQTNLQVLCHDCHVQETARQKRERIAGLWPGMPPSLNPGFASWAEAEVFIETGALQQPMDLGLA